MPPIFSFSYWFDLTPEPFIPLALPVLAGFFGLVTAIGILAKIASKMRSGNLYWSKGGAKIASLGLTMGPIGFILLWFGYEQVQFFGMRLWLLVWLIVALWWKFRIFKYLWVIAPEQAHAYAEQARINKWIPHKK